MKFGGTLSCFQTKPCATSQTLHVQAAWMKIDQGLTISYQFPLTVNIEAFGFHCEPWFFQEKLIWHMNALSWNEAISEHDQQHSSFNGTLATSGHLWPSKKSEPVRSCQFIVWFLATVQAVQGSIVRMSPQSELLKMLAAHQFLDFSHLYGYGSIPINTIFSGMNIHLPAILGFTRYQSFDPSPY